MRNHLVIGCGLIGLTTSLELLRRGHRVRLVDAAEHAGLGTSYANGGLLTPSMSNPWNAPGVLRHLAASLLSPASALKLRPSAVPSLLSWGPRFLVNARPNRYYAATIANLALSTYSLDVLKEMREEFKLAFDAADNGTLKIYRSQEALDASLAMTRLLAQHGLEVDVLDRNGAVDVEPRLVTIRDDIAGAIYYPGDAVGDAHVFCRAAAQAVERLGGVIEYNRAVRAIELRKGRVVGVRVQDDFIPAELVIIAAGIASPQLASKLGLKLRIKPAKGYSVTYSPEPSTPLPKVPVVDDALHAAVTPLGSRLRVAGTAEFAGRNLHLDPKRVANLAHLLRAIYPGLADDVTIATGKPWTGLRPMTADGRPYIGAGRVPGLWVNSGHGHLGWTMAAGSARLLADLMDGARPAIDAAPFATDR